MSSHHIYNLCVNAKWVRELCDEERFLQLKKLSEARPIWNFKELSERIGISVRPSTTGKTRDGFSRWQT